MQSHDLQLGGAVFEIGLVLGQTVEARLAIGQLRQRPADTAIGRRVQLLLAGGEDQQGNSGEGGAIGSGHRMAEVYIPGR